MYNDTDFIISHIILDLLTIIADADDDSDDDDGDEKGLFDDYDDDDDKPAPKRLSKRECMDALRAKR